MTQTRRQQVAAAVKAIRAFHALGRSLPPAASPKEAYGRRLIADEAERRGVNPDTARKARQFADPVAGYTTAELNEVCRLIKAVQAEQAEGAVFRRTHLIRVLTVPKPDRPAFQEEAIRGGWSTAELEARIAARYGVRRDGGRRLRRPRDAADLLAQIDRLCETWRRWQGSVGEPPPASAPGGTPAPPTVTLNALPRHVRAKVRGVGAAVEELHQAVADRLSRGDQRRAVRHRFR